jgi:hypothetical protein
MFRAGRHKTPPLITPNRCCLCPHAISEHETDCRGRIWKDGMRAGIEHVWGEWASQTMEDDAMSDTTERCPCPFTEAQAASRTIERALAKIRTRKRRR